MNTYSETNKPQLTKGLITYKVTVFDTENNSSFYKEIYGVDFEDAVQRESFYYRFENGLDCKVTHYNVIEFSDKTYMVYSPII